MVIIAPKSSVRRMRELGMFCSVSTAWRPAVGGALVTRGAAALVNRFAGDVLRERRKRREQCDDERDDETAHVRHLPLPEVLLVADLLHPVRRAEAE